MTTETQSFPTTKLPASKDSPAVVEAAVPLTLELLSAIFWRSRLLIFFSTLCASLLALVIALTLPLKYTAVSSFLPPGSNNTPSAAAIMGQLSGLGGGLFSSRSQGDLYIGILKSRMVGREMVRRFHLMDVYKAKREGDAEGALLGHSSFDTGLKDPIISISVTERDPELAKKLANGYLEVLGWATADLAVTESSQRRLFFEQRLGKEKDELANAEVALKQAQEKSGLIAPAGQTASEIQTLASLHAQITARQVQLASLLHDETEQNPDVVRVRSEISNLQAQVAGLESGSQKSQYGIFSTSQVPGLELEYIRRTREVKYHEALFDIIAKQYEAARLDESKDSPLQVLDRATTPETKSAPHRTIILAIGFFLGLGSSVAYVLYRSARRTKNVNRSWPTQYLGSVHDA